MFLQIKLTWQESVHDVVERIEDEVAQEKKDEPDVAELAPRLDPATPVGDSEARKVLQDSHSRGTTPCGLGGGETAAVNRVTAAVTNSCQSLAVGVQQVRLTSPLSIA